MNKDQEPQNDKATVVVQAIFTLFAIWVLIECLYWVFQIINC